MILKVVMAFAIEIEQKCETLNSVRWVIFKPPNIIASSSGGSKCEFLRFWTKMVDNYVENASHRYRARYHRFSADAALNLICGTKFGKKFSNLAPLDLSI